ncbi:hypothetical protein PCASD_21047 [Puccinia coronata f. sp. avenae]|uniref:DNA repair protein REV1 n=1 Tax=Puccinia coronata f. sp. avenae TaxID=200324 RepID=A0A2N5S9P4_9BASI|nr:hypothetical protein PCASD_21047 [Puccinia coronata f. sp. avenae]
MTADTDTQEGDIISDDEFDSLLATIPLPGLPTPCDSSSGTQLKKRKTTTPTNTNEHIEQAAYEPIQFGEISKYMTNKRKKLKLQESALRDTEPENSIRPQIFSGLVIHVNGHTKPPLSQIRSLIILHGGTYMAYLDHKSVLTHIIASSLTPKKREEFRAYKVVKPEWIVRCVSAGRLLNWSDFRTMGGSMFSDSKIAEGEATGGQAIAQRNLFDLAKDLHSSRSTQTAPHTNSHKETPSSSLSRNSHIPKPTIPTTAASSIQSTSKSAPVQSSIQNTPKAPSNLPHVTPISTHTLRSPARLIEQPCKKITETEIQLDAGVLEGNAEAPSLGRMSCLDPNFIQTYFQQSRLHHLSTWKAELLQRVSILSENKHATTRNSVVSEKKLKGDASDRRVIMHVDFDCFFIAAGLIGRPELKGKPLAVCHAKVTDSAKANGSTSEIASCSYEARAFGVRNGQTLGKAKEICPEIQTIPYDFKLYEELSFKFYNILLSYADELQAVSADECLIDVSGQFYNQFNPGEPHSIEPSALKLAEEIRTTVREATQCEVSIGISCNVLLAKLATKKAKPCGSCFLDKDRAQLILKELSIDDLPGFGWAQTNEVAQKLSVCKVGDLQSIPLSRLVDVLGPSRGKLLHQYAQGIDDRSLKSSNHERKSVSAVVNYGIRFKTTDEGGNNDVRVFLQQLGLEVSRRLHEVGVSGRQLTLKIMRRALNAPVETRKYMGHGICDDLSKTTKLSGLGGVGVTDGIIIGNEAWKLLQSMAIPPEDLRGIGIQINRLEKLSKNIHGDKPPVQSTLMFQTTKPIEPPARRQGPPNNKSNTAITNSGDRTPVGSTSKKIFKTPGVLSSTPFAIPPASQLDLGVVEALPTPLKAHILKSIATHQKSREKSKTVKPPDKRVTIDLLTPDGKLHETPNRFDLPSASQVDWKMLAELPSSVRKPIEAIYARRQSSRRLPPPTPPNFTTRGVEIARKKGKRRVPDSSQKTDRLAGLQLAFRDPRLSRPKSKISHRVAHIGPSQKLIHKKTFKLITKHQPPKTSYKGQQDQATSGRKEVCELLPTPNKISDEQLEALEIDAQFFRELQGNSTRGFQLDLIWNQYQTHSRRFQEVTQRTDRWIKWRKNFDRPAKVLQISLPEPPCLAGRGKKGLSKLEDVLELIEQWMLSCSCLPSDENRGGAEMSTKLELVEIDARDLAIIEKFLIDLIDPPPNPNHHTLPQQCLGQDFEKLGKIIQWWQDLVLKHFSPILHLPSFIYWKNILDNLKIKVNAIACRDFGAAIYDLDA